MYYSFSEHLTQITSNSHSDIELLITFTMGIIWRSTVAASFDHLCHISQASLWIQVTTMADSPKDYKQAASKTSVISLWCSALGMLAYNFGELAKLMYWTDWTYKGTGMLSGQPLPVENRNRDETNLVSHPSEWPIPRGTSEAASRIENPSCRQWDLSPGFRLYFQKEF